MTHRHIRVETLTPAIGGVVHGVDLGAILADEAQEEIRAALRDRHVLFFRDQPLSTEAFLRLGRIFGEPERHEYFPHPPGAPQIQIVHSDGTRAPDTDYWHTDVTFRAQPSLVQVLRAVELPPAGGDTLWASTGAAFDALGPALQDFLSGLRAVHDLPFFFRRVGFFERLKTMQEQVALIEKNPAVEHPVVVAHPVTGRRGLFVNSVWTKHIVGMDQLLGKHLLAMLFEWIQKPEFGVRFRWAPGSIAIWDNFATQHYAAFDYAPHPRTMHRMTCGRATPTAPAR